MRIEGCRQDEMEDGDIKLVEAENLPPIALYRVDGAFFATNDVCTHGEASLSDGDLEGFEIECPWHEGRFDVRTGAVTASPCLVPIKTYVTVVEDEVVYIEVEP